MGHRGIDVDAAREDNAACVVQYTFKWLSDLNTVRLGSRVT